MDSIRSKITLAYSAAATLLTVLLLTPIGFALQGFFYDQLISRLKTETATVELVINGAWKIQPWDQLRTTLDAIAHSSGMRITLIANDGVVLYESSLPDSLWLSMENHLHRPEIQIAMGENIGTNSRRSATLDIDMVYVARKLEFPDPKAGYLKELGFIRLGLSSRLVNEQIRRIWFIVIIGGILGIASIILVSRAVAYRITRPLTEIADAIKEIKAGDLNKLLPARTNDEIGRLSELINEMTRKLRDDIERLQKLERFRSEFLGNVSHELRTPIFSLKGFLETLLEGAIDDKDVNKKFVSRAYHHASRLDALLTDLIEISRLESGDMKMSFRYFDLIPFLETVREDYADEAKKKAQNLVMETSAREILAFGDKDRLGEAIGSILDNAIKYSPSGASIVLRVAEVQDKVRISVEDNGPGIPSEHMSRIFERFYRVDKNRSREVGGTGLGLAIAKHIVEAHMSKINVKSELGKGSIFSFDLKK